MKTELKKKALKLRKEEKLSYSQIKEKLDVPKSTLSNWLQDYPLSEERIKELQREGAKKMAAKAEKYRNTMREKREQERQRIYHKYKERFSEVSKETFFVAGLILYLSEGGKTNPSQIALSNTDSKIIKFFIEWMKEFLNVGKREMKARLHLYEDMDIGKEKEFWKEELGFQKDQFYKSDIRKPTENSFSYKDPSRHGTCDLFFCNKEKKQEIMMAAQAFIDKYGDYK